MIKLGEYPTNLSSSSRSQGTERHIVLPSLTAYDSVIGELSARRWLLFYNGGVWLQCGNFYSVGFLGCLFALWNNQKMIFLIDRSLVTKAAPSPHSLPTLLDHYSLELGRRCQPAMNSTLLQVTLCEQTHDLFVGGNKPKALGVGVAGYKTVLV